MAQRLPQFCPTPPAIPTDTLTEPGANRLAKQIKSIWAKLGYDVETRVERGFAKDGASLGCFVVRSDMIGGMPRRRLSKGAA